MTEGQQMPDSQREAELIAKQQRQIKLAKDAIREIQGGTGDSSSWGSLLREHDEFSGGGMGKRTDLTPEQKARYRQVKSGLEDAFGRRVLDVFNEWKRAEGVRNAVAAQQPKGEQLF